MLLAVLVGSATLCAVTVTFCAISTLGGVAYKPVESIVPTAGLRNHVTAVFDVPVTFAVNCWVWPAFKFTIAGDNEITTAEARVIIALADLVESAILVAVIGTL